MVPGAGVLPRAELLVWGISVFSAGVPWALVLPVVVAVAVRFAGEPEGPWRFVAVGVAAVLGLVVDVWAGRWAAHRCVGDSGGGGR